MENAPKALLIAGAILIVIFLICVAVLIVNSISGVTDQSEATSESYSTQIFNSQFTTYFRNSATGSQAKALVSKIIQNNASVNSSRFSPDSHHIYVNLYPKGETKITHKWKTRDLNNIYNKISQNAKYNIYNTTCGTYPKGYYKGYIICISIKQI